MADYSKIKAPSFRSVAERSKPLTIEELLAIYSPMTNIGKYSGNFIHPQAKAMAYPPGEYNVAGFVHNSYPDTMFLSDKRTTRPDIIPHEATHIQQNLTKRPLPDVKNIRPKETYDFKALNAYDDMDELVANLQAKEAVMPAGQRWYSDPALAAIFPKTEDRQVIDKRLYPHIWREGEEGFVGPSKPAETDILTKLKKLLGL